MSVPISVQLDLTSSAGKVTPHENWRALVLGLNPSRLLESTWGVLKNISIPGSCPSSMRAEFLGEENLDTLGRAMVYIAA